MCVFYLYVYGYGMGLQAISEQKEYKSFGVTN